jgi:trigger factor
MTETTDLRISTQSPSQWGRILSIAVPRSRYDAVRSDVARDLRKRVTRPGFRKGHVPAAIVERDFASRIEESTLERIIPEACDQAIRREGLEILSQPRVQNLVLDDPESVRFDVALEIQPRIELRPIDGLKGSRWTAVVADEHLDRALEDLREEQAQLADVEREAQDGDFVVVAYVPLAEDGTERADQRVENYPFRLGAGDVVTEFEAAARGRRVGESARVAIAYPADHEDPTLAGRTVAFQVEVRAVKEKHLPALDDDLARDLGFEDVAALRQRVRTDLERRVGEESQRDLRESLVDHLLRDNVFEAPQSMVEQFLEVVRNDWEERQQRLRMPPPDDAQRQEFLAATRPAAERMVRRGLLLEHVARQYGITVSEEDVDKWIEERVLAGGSRGAELRAFFADGRRRRRLRSDLVEDRVFEFLTSKAEITEVAPTAAPGAGGE